MSPSPSESGPGSAAERSAPRGVLRHNRRPRAMARTSSQTAAGGGPGAEYGPRTLCRPPGPAGTSGSTIPFPGAIRNVPGGHPRRSRAGPCKIADPASPGRPPKAGIRSAQALSQLLLPGSCAVYRCLCRVKAPEAFFSRSGLCFPTVRPKPVKVRNQPPLFEPDVVCQYIPPIGIVADTRQIRPSPVFVSKQPQLPCVDSARSPKLNDGLAALRVSTVPCVLALWAVGQNQVAAASSQWPCGGLLNLLDWQRLLVWSIVEIRHLTLRPQSLQDPAEPWRTVRIYCSA